MEDLPEDRLETELFAALNTQSATDSDVHPTRKSSVKATAGKFTA
jgi:hypothetical protein